MMVVCVKMCTVCFLEFKLNKFKLFFKNLVTFFVLLNSIDLVFSTSLNLKKKSATEVNAKKY